MKRVLEYNEMKKDLKKVETFLENYINFLNPSLKESSLHLLQAGGKRIRPAFVLLAGKVFDEKCYDELIPMAAAVELIHMASLVHDDIVDNADTRRGKPTIRVIWGNKFSLHTGDFLFAQALKLVNPQKNVQIAKILAKVSVEMCRGEIYQLLFTYDTEQSIKDYFFRIKRKTALLIAASCQIGAISQKASINNVKAFYRYGYYLGMAFQIKDDILDIESTSKNIGKPAGSDIAQGLVTLPTILALKENNTSSKELKWLINNRFPNGNNDVCKAINIIKHNKCLEKANAFSEKFIEKAKEQINIFSYSPYKKRLVEIADYINERDF